MSSLIPQQTRSLNDMLASERTLRASSESAARELRQLLLELAVRLDGERMERVRHADPRAPGNWTVGQWSEFIKGIPVSESWGRSASPTPASAREEGRQVRELLAQIEDLNQRLTAASKDALDLKKERDRLQAAISAAAGLGEGKPAKDAQSADVAVSALPDVMEGAIAPWIFLLEDAKKTVRELPRPCPALQKAFKGGGRKGGDLQKAFARVYAALHLAGKRRLSSTMEIDALLGGATDAAARSGSLRRVVDDMLKEKLFESATLQMGLPKTSLKVARLSKKGAELYRELFQSEPLEDDWSRLIRLHEGGRFKEHTLAVLAFGLHARKRGYYTRVLPDVEGSAAPDLWIARGDERLFVEAELGDKEHAVKWKNLAALNDGRAAICAGTSRLRERFVGDCKLDESGAIKSGFAVDLETLVKSKYLDVDPAAPLWSDAW